MTGWLPHGGSADIAARLTAGRSGLPRFAEDRVRGIERFDTAACRNSSLPALGPVLDGAGVLVPRNLAAARSSALHGASPKRQASASGLHSIVRAACDGDTGRAPLPSSRSSSRSCLRGVAEAIAQEVHSPQPRGKREGHLRGGAALIRSDYGGDAFDIRRSGNKAAKDNFHGMVLSADAVTSDGEPKRKALQGMKAKLVAELMQGPADRVREPRVADCKWKWQDRRRHPADFQRSRSVDASAGSTAYQQPLFADSSVLGSEAAPSTCYSAVGNASGRLSTARSRRSEYSVASSRSSAASYIAARRSSDRSSLKAPKPSKHHPVVPLLPLDRIPAKQPAVLPAPAAGGGNARPLGRHTNTSSLIG
eukprot:TRINITY_DN47520_c0_g1_i1.p1 TRINITY_DN47520_c0_g1~~TRINITY_DN47520_c0_g1_i1.p1  ORF type:complete len:365 (+),score=55.86 TRINITY_DN47520_c0_g1_i1:155-1249(+)